MATKKPTAAQLKARKLFAERAKAGTLKKSPTRKSQATGKKPTKRLIARRVSTEKAPKGYFANPIEKRGAKDVKKWYARRADNKETFLGQGIRVYEFACATQAHAEKLARELANQFNVSYVVEYK